MINKGGYVYIITNKKNGTLYTGVTSDLVKRIWEHKNKAVEGFSSKYGLDKLVFIESFSDIEQAIFAEKKLKGLTRAKKLKMIEDKNPEWEDLYIL